MPPGLHRLLLRLWRLGHLTAGSALAENGSLHSGDEEDGPILRRARGNVADKTQRDRGSC